jgi:hypothetical protein
MKKQIRNSVFESNSSSTHSLTVHKNGLNQTLEVDEFTNKVITHFGEFGWGYDVFTDPETKLSYLVTMLVETHSNCYSIEELCETEQYSLINDAVALHCNCDGILIDEVIRQDSWEDEKYDWNEHEGYVDHQSVMDIQKLLDYYDCTVEEFIFDDGIKLIIDCDN